jgi:hypothetical protein
MVPAGSAHPQTVGGSTNGSSSSFDAVTAAYGFDSTISNPSLPLGLVIEAAGPTAQAHLSSIGAADAFSSFPYPGDTVTGLPGLLSAVFLGGLTIPPYPFYATSSIGSEPASANYPGISLSSESQASQARANAVVGTSATGYTANAVAWQDPDSTVHATASATMNVNQLGGLLTLSGVQSSATEVMNPDGSMQGTSSLSIGHLAIPALRITIPTTTPSVVNIPIPIPGIPQLPPLKFPPIPLPFGGMTLNAPDIGFVDGVFTLTLPIGGKQTFALPAQTVLDAFKALGITMAFQPSHKTANSVVAAALTIHTVLPAPPHNAYFNGSTPIDITLGRSSASIQGSVTPAGSSPVGPAGSADLGSTDLGVPPSSAALGGVTSSTDTGTSASPASLQSTPGVVSPSLATPRTALRSSPRRVVTAGHRAGLGSVFDLYLILLAVAVIGIVASQVLSFVGVRSSWKS